MTDLKNYGLITMLSFNLQLTILRNAYQCITRSIYCYVKTKCGLFLRLVIKLLEFYRSIGIPSLRNMYIDSAVLILYLPNLTAKLY